MEQPEIWNPHTWNPNALVTIRPTSFQLTMLSTDPGGTSLGATTGTPYTRNHNLVNSDSLSDPNLPGPFTFTGAAAPVLTFSIPVTAAANGPPTASFFREPTLLNKPDLASRTVTEPGPPIGSSVATTTFTSGYIASYYKSAAYTGNSPHPGVTWSNSNYDNQKYIGFNLAPGSSTYPLWYPDPNTTGKDDEVSDISFGGNTNFTYRLQYLDPLGSGKYITYDEKFMPLAYPENGADYNSNTFLGNGGVPGASPWTTAYWFVEYDLVGGSDYTVVTDPRSDRWVDTNVFSARDSQGLLFSPPLSPSNATGTPYWQSWIDASQNAIMSARPDYSIGWPVANPPATLGFYNAPTTTANITVQYMSMGIMAQNTTASYTSNYQLPWANAWSGTGTSGAGLAQYYTDPDGVVRRGTAGYSTAMSTSGTPPNPYGIPTATATTYGAGTGTPTPAQDGNRALILSRPFRSVAELGYTYSGTPWRNIDFFTPESGYAALLDVFCINDTNDPGGLVAGKVNLNTRQSAVLAAVLAGAYKNELSSSSSLAGATPSPNAFPGSTTMLASEASALMTDPNYGFVTYRTANTTSASLGPLRNVSELVGKWITNSSTTVPVTGSSVYSGFSADMNNISATTGSTPPMNVVQRFHESAIRALSNVGTTRVWNLMIDVIAQTGRFPSSAASLTNFNVEGERRYWVHVAIDRYTGKVLDQQVEEVKE
jgi:hypothetical protein